MCSASFALYIDVFITFKKHILNWIYDLYSLHDALTLHIPASKIGNYQIDLLFILFRLFFLYSLIEENVLPKDALSECL